MTEQTTPPPKRTRAKPSADDVVAAIVKRRASEEKLLRKRREDLDKQINDLIDEYDTISELLGEDPRGQPAAEQGEPRVEGTYIDLPEHVKIALASNSPIIPAGKKRCADCNALVDALNARGDCPACGAGPFEEAK